MSERTKPPKRVPREPAVLEGHWPFDSASVAEKKLLRGELPRADEYERAIHVFEEFLSGIRKLHGLGPTVTVFGSARFPEDHPYYELALHVGEKLAREGFTVMTGGGPGIMEAANRGAQSAGGRSVGCNIVLPHEQAPNPYLDTFIEFDHFFVRKVMLLKYSCAFIVCPGGFGTLDEVFETVTLIQTNKMDSFPVVALCEEFWHHLREFIRKSMIEAKTIHPDDLELIRLTDSPAEAVRWIVDSCGRPGSR